MNYEPGTVAVATVRGVPNVRVFLAASGVWVSGTRVEGCDLHRVNHDVTDVRPLVVLDPDDREAAHRLTGLYEDGVKALAHQCRILDLPNGDVTTMQEALRSLATTSPKPAEPTGLGAVVEDAKGADWHRTREGRWIAEDGLRSRAAGWGHIDAVKVLSEGVVND